MCGKDSLIVICFSFLLGSPPRVREGHKIWNVMILRARITPACAGRTEIPFEILQDKEDHPRVCGKDESKISLPISCKGSPPRVREGHSQSLVGVGLDRITPACAGRTFLYFLSSSIFWDHPRVCGKDIDYKIFIFIG